MKAAYVSLNEWINYLDSREKTRYYYTPGSFGPHDYRVSIEHFVEEHSKLLEDLSWFESLEESYCNFEDWLIPLESTLLGYQELNGFSFLGVTGQGNREEEVFFIIYKDQEGKIRGYIPKDGNFINPHNNRPVGNDEELDQKFYNEKGYKDYDDYKEKTYVKHYQKDIEKRKKRSLSYNDVFDFEKIKKDIIKFVS